MPYFMIFSLVLSSIIGGVVFNFNFKVVKTADNTISLEVEKPIVQAQDTASTTVTVQNAPPAFSVAPAENPVSTSSSPINVGDSISFEATADDPEDHDYYLIICSTDAVSPANGGAPSCDVTTFCTSVATADTVQATCSYTVADPGDETDEWYAFVCDGHADEADCVETASQGSAPGTGDSSSPFYVNHAPHMDALSTTIDNQDPGGTFQYTATSTDDDIADVDDVLTLDICSTNSWATSTGCTATTFCTATGTDVISCEWTDTAPTVDTDYNYWGFVKDHHDMEADNNSLNSDYTINNVAPVVTGVYLVPNNGTEILLNLRDAAAINVVASSTTVVDQNGCADILSATSTIYWENATGAYECDADDSDCYPIASGSCTLSDCVGAQMTITCDTDLEYIARPTDGSSDVSGTTWIASLRVFDEALSSVGTTTVGTDIQTNTALEITETTIAYGSLKSNENTGTTSATTTIENFGNSPLNVGVSGTDMNSGGDVIPIANQKYDLAAGFDWSSAGTTASIAETPVDVVAGRPTTLGGTSDELYWGIGVPAVPSGDYGGTNTFAAQLDALDW